MEGIAVGNNLSHLSVLQSSLLFVHKYPLKKGLWSSGILRKNGKQAPLSADVAEGHLLKPVTWPLAQEPPEDT